MRNTRCAMVAMSTLLVAASLPGQEKPSNEALRAEAKALADVVESELAGAFLRQVERLPRPSPRVVYVDPKRRHYLAPAAWESLDTEAQSAYRRTRIPADRYYTTKYGTPLAYVRVLDVAAKFGVGSLAGKRVLDFGYGTVGHLRLIAQMGVDAVGVDVDAFLPALYSEPGDCGVVANDGGRDRRITMVNGKWPADKGTVDHVGDRYDLVTSKNTLKRGYVHPAKKVDPRMLVHLDVDDGRFVREVFRILRPGGLFVIYNISPKQNPPGERYLPWADGRCPFERGVFEGVGFEVLAYDLTDDRAARAMGAALGWQEQMGDLEKELFTHATVVRKPE